MLLKTTESIIERGMKELSKPRYDIGNKHVITVLQSAPARYTIYQLSKACVNLRNVIFPGLELEYAAHGNMCTENMRIIENDMGREISDIIKKGVIWLSIQELESYDNRDVVKKIIEDTRFTHPDAYYCLPGDIIDRYVTIILGQIETLCFVIVNNITDDYKAESKADKKFVRSLIVFLFQIYFVIESFLSMEIE